MVAADVGRGVGLGSRHRRLDGRSSRLSGARGSDSTGPSAPGRCCPRCSTPPPWRGRPCRRSSAGSIDTRPAQPSKFSNRGPGRSLRPPTSWPASWPRIPVSSQVSGPPRRACSPPTARAAPWLPRRSHLSTLRRSATARTRFTSARPDGDSASSPHSSSGSSAMCVTRLRSVGSGREGRPGGRINRPTLLALDEVANIAPIPDLTSMVSEGAGQGLLVLACLQDLSQARARWGQSADGFLSLFGTTASSAGSPTRRRCGTSVHSPAIAKSPPRPSAAPSGDGAGSVLRLGRPTCQPRLPVDAVAGVLPERALVLGPHKEVQQVSLTPAHAHSPWRELRPLSVRSPALTRGPGRSRSDRGPSPAPPSRVGGARARRASSRCRVVVDVIGKAVHRKRSEARRRVVHPQRLGRPSHPPALPVPVDHGCRLGPHRVPVGIEGPRSQGPQHVNPSARPARAMSGSATPVAVTGAAGTTV